MFIQTCQNQHHAFQTLARTDFMGTGWKKSSDQYYRLILLMTDLSALVAAYISALLIRFNPEIGEPLFTTVNTFLGLRETGALGSGIMDFYISSAGRIIGILSLILVFLYAFSDLYEGRRFLRKRPITWIVIRSNLIALLLFFGYFYLRRNVFHPRSIFLLILALNCCYCVWFRVLTAALLRKIRRLFNLPPCPVVLVGQSREADFIHQYLDTFAPHDLKLAVHLPLALGGDTEALQGTLKQACQSASAGVLILADPDISVSQIMQTLEWAADEKITVKILSDRMNVLVHPGRLSVDFFYEKPLVHFAPPRHPWRIAWDHLWSVTLATLALIPTLPLMALCAILIRLTSRGPALFVQERIGVNRRPFLMFKFRTMFNRADEKLADIEALNESGQGLFKIRKDPRVTPVGRFLRRFSLDELPQLFNVLRGDMNIVGPRPLPRRDFNNYYEKWHYNRHDGLPGLTCLWQVSGRSDIDFHNMCILDVYYLRNRSSVLDAKILLRTIGVVLFAKGAY
jgi:exopolysaccharide biosynthesis polyprenyl glycosylphosphotransferase